MILSPLLSPVAGTEGPCVAANTRLYSHLLGVVLGRGRGSLYTEEKSPI